ncbi:MAG: cellulase family glycosylhydrolase [Candidatus Omnitrophica bacterium]|nr:cellulase family glycosylhydrolase [Candidatus Omnitrophota bacterium]MDD5430349.1 cellulase family glycosylhydrolase [Candidatus Omnitrophota bacterium]
MVIDSGNIRGVNLGGWLLMEGYILRGRNIPESLFKENFKKVFGEKELRDFERLFRGNFIIREDFKNISQMGANAIRVPFHYKLIESKPYRYSQEGFNYLDKIFSWAGRHSLGVILDLHAACGSQNYDWHSDSCGKALLWKNKEYSKRTVALWESVSDRYKDNDSLIGYDFLNEPVLEDSDLPKLKSLYGILIKRIREIDRNHTFFLEGSLWAQRIDFLKDLLAENIAVSIHNYLPLEYTFNFSPFLNFPGKINKVLWCKDRILKHLEPYYLFSRKNNVKIFVGEFGINWRGGFWGELRWLEAVLEAYKEYGFGYTYWTYKAVANNVFPDGIYQYIPNSKYVNRQGPLYGWETYSGFWKKNKKDLGEFWKTNGYCPNPGIISMLKKHFILEPQAA